jgi:hypothetical protein
MIVPSFPALLPQSAGDVLGNVRPFISSTSLDCCQQELVLLLGPGLFGKEQIVYECLGVRSGYLFLAHRFYLDMIIVFNGQMIINIWMNI